MILEMPLTAESVPGVQRAQSAGVLEQYWDRFDSLGAGSIQRPKELTQQLWLLAPTFLLQSSSLKPSSRVEFT